MALTKNDLAEHLSSTIGLKKKESLQLVELFFEEIRSSLERGEPAKLSGFGKFIVRDKNERPGRNPKARIETLITRRRVVTFRAGHKLKSRVEKHAKPKEKES